jgi:hypothetical protein
LKGCEIVSKNKEKVEICKCKFLEAIKLIDTDVIDIAEYNDGTYEYHINKNNNVIKIFAENSDLIFISDELIGYKYK